MKIVGPLTYRDLIPIGTAIAGYVAGTLKVAAANVRDRRKALNTILYALLKLRSEARSGNPRELLLQIRRFMVARFGLGVLDLLTRSDLRAFVYQTVQDATTAKMTVAIEQYREAVKAPAPFYPLLAHRLDADRAANLQTLIRSYYERVRLQPDLTEAHSNPQAMDLMEDQTLDLAFTKALERLSNDVHAVAGKLWWLSRRAALTALRHQDLQVQSKASVSGFTTDAAARGTTRIRPSHSTASALDAYLIKPAGMMTVRNEDAYPRAR